MGLKNNYTDSMLRQHFQNVMLNIERAILAQLFRLGEMCVNHAREFANRIGGGFDDQTGNLRNSIGYIILKNGREVNSNFLKTAKPKIVGATGSEGLATGIAFARSLISKYSNGYALIVVVGMEYAKEVESRGQNVLTASQQLAEERLPGMIRQIEESIKRQAA